MKHIRYCRGRFIDYPYITLTFLLVKCQLGFPIAARYLAFAKRKKLISSNQVCQSNRVGILALPSRIYRTSEQRKVYAFFHGDATISIDLLGILLKQPAHTHQFVLTKITPRVKASCTHPVSQLQPSCTLHSQGPFEGSPETLDRYQSPGRSHRR